MADWFLIAAIIAIIGGLAFVMFRSGRRRKDRDRNAWIGGGASGGWDGGGGDSGDGGGRRGRLGDHGIAGVNPPRSSHPRRWNR